MSAQDIEVHRCASEAQARFLNLLADGQWTRSWGSLGSPKDNTVKRTKGDHWRLDIDEYDSVIFFCPWCGERLDESES